MSVASRAMSESAGIESSFQRRDEEWRHQVELANKDLAQITSQIAAAEIRCDIATESQKVHEKSLEQVQEIFDFLRDRFTNFGRYTFLCTELQKLHRVAFDAALSMARLAEQAAQFEHPDEKVLPSLSGDYWDAGNSGLLAGERLLLDLYNLERSYIESNHRPLEIEQSFSLAQFDPDALSKLTTECSCDFKIPEWFYDLTYPGHFRRRIKGVRLTIPCVVGPHANVGATLQLRESYIRRQPALDEPAIPVPLRHTVTMAASQGQSDAGVFEFNFRDERYMPFEGAGAASTWNLTLPKVVKAFDYNTITDVVLRVSYTAEQDDDLKVAMEGATGVLAKLSATGVTRMLSLRRDFPDVWYKLVGGASDVTIDVQDFHLPFFMSTFKLEQASFDLLVSKLASSTATYPKVKFDTPDTSAPGNDASSGLYLLGRSVPVDVVAKHTVTVTSLGSAGIADAGGTRTRLDTSKIGDIAIRVVLKRKVPTH
jgi:hypothetical protein